MSRFGLNALIGKWAKGDEQHQEDARKLRAMDEQNVPVSNFLMFFDELKTASVLPFAAWLCLVTDLVEEEASSAASAIVGSENDYFLRYWYLQGELSSELTDVLASFLERNPMPMTQIESAIEALREYVTDEVPRERIVPQHHELASAKTAEIMPRTFRQFGCGDLADLLEKTPQQFKSMKEEGERFLIGMTYAEEGERSVREFFGDPSA